MARSSEEDEFAYSISITEPTKDTEEKELSPSKEPIQLSKNVYKEEQKAEEGEKSPRDSARMRVPIFSKKGEELKSEPPDSKEKEEEIDPTLLRSRSAGRKSQTTEQGLVPNVMAEAVRTTIKFNYSSRKEI